MIRFSGSLAALLLFLGALPLQCQNLLENGSFEAPSRSDPGTSVSLLRAGDQSLRPWIIGGGGIAYAGTVVTASDGQRSVHLQFIQPGFVEQSFPTVAGQAYQVSFDVSAFVGTSGASARLHSGRASAIADGAEIAGRDFSYDGTGKSFPNVGWSSFTLDFTATSAQTSVRFLSAEATGTGPMLDNVRVVPGSEDSQGNWVINGAPVFSKRLPAEVKTALGLSLRLEAEALGALPLTYQWYRVNGSAYTAVAGATSNVYEIPSIAFSHRGRHAVVAGNDLAAITNFTDVTIVSPPGFPLNTLQEQRVSVGGRLSLSPNGSQGSSPDTYQWYRDGAAIPGATNQTFTKNSATLEDAGTYHLEGINIAGKAVSDSAQVTVIDGPVPPWIRFQPQPWRAFQIGSFLTLESQGLGAEPLGYFWFKDGKPLPNGAVQYVQIPNAQASDSGIYHFVVSNAVGVVASQPMQIVVHPPQTPPFFNPGFYQTNSGEGLTISLEFTLVRGEPTGYQWFKRPADIFTGEGDPVPSGNQPTLTLQNLTLADAGTYICIASNYVGLTRGEVILSIVGKPQFSQPPQGFEGVAGSFVNLNASIQNFSPDLTYQWLRNGTPIPGAASSQYSFALSAATAGTYTVVARNASGETSSSPAVVAIRELTPAARTFRLVADQTIEIPERAGSFFTVVGDGKLRGNVVTFQGTRGFPDIGGLYRWEDGAVEKVVDLEDTLPGFTAPPTWLESITAEEGVVHFISESTNSAPENRFALVEWQNGSYRTIANQQTAVPGKAALKFNRFGYPTREGGKTAFFGLIAQEFGTYRGVFVYDGTRIEKWADSDTPLPAGDGVWFGNSAQVGFDGTLLAFWAVDGTQPGGGRNGIFYTINASSLQKIAFTGDAIPGGGVFKGFNSPPLVHQGKVLFIAQAENAPGNLLLEFTPGQGMRIVARSGDAPSGAGPISSIGHSFDYLSDGSILFSASGPGAKQGIYRWSNGALSEELTSLNSINGRAIRFVSLYDVDGDDCLITVSFDGSRFGLWTTAGGGQPPKPKLVFLSSTTSLTFSWSSGVLQRSADLKQWSDLPDPSPKIVNFSESERGFFRVRE